MPNVATVYCIVHPGQRHGKRHHVEWPAAPGLELIRSVVDPVLGDPWEHVMYLHEDGDYASMFVDELGHQKMLARNQVATRHYRRNARERLGYQGDLEDLPFVVGPAVIFDRRIWF